MDNEARGICKRFYVANIYIAIWDFSPVFLNQLSLEKKELMQKSMFGDDCLKLSVILPGVDM